MPLEIYLLIRDGYFCEKSKISSVNVTTNKAKLPKLNMGGKAKVAFLIVAKTH